jgi:hypothetical protein
MSSALTPAERARLYRERKRGGPARTLSDDPLARAKRRMRKGAKVADLDPAEREAVRAYQREQARKRRTS